MQPDRQSIHLQEIEDFLQILYNDQNARSCPETTKQVASLLTKYLKHNNLDNAPNYISMFLELVAYCNFKLPTDLINKLFARITSAKWKNMKLRDFAIVFNAMVELGLAKNSQYKNLICDLLANMDCLRVTRQLFYPRDIADVLNAIAESELIQQEHYQIIYDLFEKIDIELWKQYAGEKSLSLTVKFITKFVLSHKKMYERLEYLLIDLLSIVTSLSLESFSTEQMNELTEALTNIYSYCNLRNTKEIIDKIFIKFNTKPTIPTRSYAQVVSPNAKKCNTTTDENASALQIETTSTHSSAEDQLTVSNSKPNLGDQDKRSCSSAAFFQTGQPHYTIADEQAASTSCNYDLKSIDFSSVESAINGIITAFSYDHEGVGLQKIVAAIKAAKDLKSAISIIQTEVEKGYLRKINAYLINCLMSKCRDRDNFYLAEKLFNASKHLYNVAIYSNFIRIAGHAGNFPLAQEIFMISVNKKFADSISFHNFIAVAASYGQFEQALCALQMAQEQALDDVAIYSSFIFIAIEAGNLKLALECFSKAKRMSQCDMKLYYNFITAIGMAIKDEFLTPDEQLVLELLQEALNALEEAKVKFPEATHTNNKLYNCFLTAVGNAMERGLPREKKTYFLEQAKIIYENLGSSADSFTHSSFMILLANAGKLDIVLQVFDKNHSREDADISLYSSFITAMEKVIRSRYLSSEQLKTAITKANEVFLLAEKRFPDRNIVHYITFINFLSAAIESGVLNHKEKWSAFIHAYDILNKLSTGSFIGKNGFLEFCSSFISNAGKLIELGGLTKDEKTTIIKAINKALILNARAGSLRPRFIESLYICFIMAMNDNDVFPYALDLFNKVKEKLHSPKIYGAFINIAEKNGRFSEAEQAFHEVKAKKLVNDCHKRVYLNVLVKQRRYEEAMILFNELHANQKFVAGVIDLHGFSFGETYMFLSIFRTQDPDAFYRSSFIIGRGLHSYNEQKDRELVAAVKSFCEKFKLCWYGSKDNAGRGYFEDKSLQNNHRFHDDLSRIQTITRHTLDFTSSSDVTNRSSEVTNQPPKVKHHLETLWQIEEPGHKKKVKKSKPEALALTPPNLDKDKMKEKEKASDAAIENPSIQPITQQEETAVTENSLQPPIEIKDKMKEKEKASDAAEETAVTENSSQPPVKIKKEEVFQMTRIAAKDYRFAVICTNDHMIEEITNVVNCVLRNNIGVDERVAKDTILKCLRESICGYGLFVPRLFSFDADKFKKSLHKEMESFERQCTPIVIK